MSIFRHSLLAGSLAVLAPAEVGPVIAAAPLRESSTREVNINQHNTRAVLLNRRRFSYEVTVEPIDDNPLPKPITNPNPFTHTNRPVNQPNRYHNSNGAYSHTGHLLSKSGRKGR